VLLVLFASSSYALTYLYNHNYDTKKSIDSLKCRAASLPPNQLTPLIPNSSAMITAAFSPMTSAVEYVFAATFEGGMDKSATLSPWTPYTLRRGSTTPPRSRGFIAQVPS